MTPMTDAPDLPHEYDPDVRVLAASPQYDPPAAGRPDESFRLTLVHWAGGGKMQPYSVHRLTADGFFVDGHYFTDLGRATHYWGTRLQQAEIDGRPVGSQPFTREVR